MTIEKQDKGRVNFRCDPQIKQRAIDNLPTGVTLTDALSAFLAQIAEGKIIIKSKLSIERANSEGQDNVSNPSP